MDPLPLPEHSTTIDKSPRWQRAFAVLGIDRCWPFLPELGVPSSIASEPRPAARHVRVYLELAALSEESDAGGETRRRSRLEDVFAQIAHDYDRASAESLLAWCLDYFVSDDLSFGLLAWGQLLRRLCGMITGDPLPTSPDLDPALLSALCVEITDAFDPARSKTLRRRIDQARTEPLSEWEKWLDDEVRRQAGGGPQVIGAVDSALDSIKSVASARALLVALRSISDRMSTDERDRWLIWATREAERFGASAEASRAVQADLSVIGRRTG